MIYDSEIFGELKNDGIDLFIDLPINQKARNDFKFLCSQSNFLVKNNVNNYAISKDGKIIGDFFPVGYNVKNRSVAIPEKFIDVEKEDLYIAVVCYENEEVKDVFVFKAREFKHMGGKLSSLFSMFKHSSKVNQYAVVLGDGEKQKLKQSSFGVALSEYTK